MDFLARATRFRGAGFAAGVLRFDGAGFCGPTGSTGGGEGARGGVGAGSAWISTAAAGGPSGDPGGSLGSAPSWWPSSSGSPSWSSKGAKLLLGDGSSSLSISICTTSVSHVSCRCATSCGSCFAARSVFATASCFITSVGAARGPEVVVVTRSVDGTFCSFFR